MLLTYSRFVPLLGPFSILDENGDGNISNWEFFQALDPNNLYGNDYVFDNFKWDHCQESTYSAAIKKTYKLDGMSW
jgi:Ca2+-binding EF-hand superfamily protein